MSLWFDIQEIIRHWLFFTWQSNREFLTFTLLEM